MRLDTFWVVTDATPDSTLGDICWQVISPVQLANVIVGAGGSQTVAHERWTFYSDEAKAKRDARRRLSEVVRVVIDHEAYGDRAEFATLPAAERAYRRLADATQPEWATVAFHLASDGTIVDDAGRQVGRRLDTRSA